MPTPEKHIPKSPSDNFGSNSERRDVPWSVRLQLSPNEIYALNAEMRATQVFDDAYWAWSLAEKPPEPFVM